MISKSRVIFLSYLALIFLVLSACKKTEKDEVSSLSVYIYHADKPKIEEFVYQKKKLDSVITFNYTSQKDSSKVIDIEFYLKSNIFNFGGENFILSKSKIIYKDKISGMDFYYYVLENPSIDGTGPILFNKDYGLLAIFNVFGPMLIFRKENDINNYNEDVFMNLKNYDTNY
jgi:hypothetical protein